MINDANMSRRLALRSAANQSVSALILSHLYWPEQLVELDAADGGRASSPPSNIDGGSLTEQLAQQYSVRASSLKELVWRPAISRARIQIDFANGSFEFSCGHLEAELIIGIPPEEPCSLGRLEALFFSRGWDRRWVQRALQFWLEKRVLLRDPSSLCFHLADSYDPTAPGKKAKEDDDDHILCTPHHCCLWRCRVY